MIDPQVEPVNISNISIISNTNWDWPAVSASCVGSSCYRTCRHGRPQFPLHRSSDHDRMLLPKLMHPWAVQKPRLSSLEPWTQNHQATRKVERSNLWLRVLYFCWVKPNLLSESLVGLWLTCSIPHAFRLEISIKMGSYIGKNTKICLTMSITENLKPGSIHPLSIYIRSSILKHSCGFVWK